MRTLATTARVSSSLAKRPSLCTSPRNSWCFKGPPSGLEEPVLEAFVLLGAGVLRQLHQPGHGRAAPQRSHLILVCGETLRPVDDPQGDPLLPLVGLGPGGLPVRRVVVLVLQVIYPLAVPVIRIHTVEGDAGLEDIDEG